MGDARPRVVAASPTSALDGPLTVDGTTVPASGAYGARYTNTAIGPALDATMTLTVDGDTSISAATGATVAGVTATWTVGSIGGDPGVAGDPPASAALPVSLTFATRGDHVVTLAMTYRVGLSTFTAGPTAITVRVTTGGTGGTDAGGGGDGAAGGGCCGASGGRGSVILAATVALALAARRRRRAILA